jgi:hypothetical protein
MADADTRQATAGHADPDLRAPLVTGGLIAGMPASGDASVVPLAKTATTAIYGGSASAIFGGLNANEFAAIGGILIGLAGLIVNIWFKWQHLKIARAAAKADTEE